VLSSVSIPEDTQEAVACTEMLDPYVDRTDLQNEVDGPLRIKKLWFLLEPLVTVVLLLMANKFCNNRQTTAESCSGCPWYIFAFDIQDNLKHVLNVRRGGTMKRQGSSSLA